MSEEAEDLAFCDVTLAKLIDEAIVKMLATMPPPIDPNLPPEVHAAHAALFEPPTLKFRRYAPPDHLTDALAYAFNAAQPPAAEPTPAKPSPAQRWYDRFRSWPRR